MESAVPDKRESVTTLFEKIDVEMPKYEVKVSSAEWGRIWCNHENIEIIFW